MTLTGLTALTLLLGGCDAELYHGLSERQVNGALVRLREAGFAADKRAEGGARDGRRSFVLVVPRAEETRALKLLAAEGLPRAAARPREAGLSALASPEEARSRQAEELAEQLAGTLEALPGVQEARVHLALPPEEPLRPEGQLRPTASVLLRLRGPAPGKDEVERLVARAVPGLDPQDVGVTSAQAPSGTIEPSQQAPQAPIARVGPLWVAEGSRGLAALLLGLPVLLAAALFILLGRQGLRRERLAGPAAPPG